MKPINHIRLFIQLNITLLLLFFSCSTNDLSGTGTDTSTKETYTTVHGTILNKNNTPSQKSIVYLVPIAYNPITDEPLSNYSIDTTDNNGDYQVSVSSSGLYNIMAVSKNLNEISFRKRLYIEEKKNAALTTDTLKTGNYLKYYPTSKMITDGGFVFLQGTPFYKKITSGEVLLNNVPSQSPPLCYIKNAQAGNTLNIRDSITTDCTDTVRVFRILLLMTNSSDINNSLILQHIRKIGGIITTTDSASVKQLADNDFNVILITPSADVTKIDTLLTNISVPIINSKYILYSKLGMTGPVQGNDFGYINEQECIIVQSTHQIARNISGDIAVFKKAKSISWGIPTSNADIIATYKYRTSFPVLFCYEKNAMMYNKAAPARRVGFFVESNLSLSFMTDSGWLLLENAVLWSINK